MSKKTILLQLPVIIFAVGLCAQCGLFVSTNGSSISMGNSRGDISRPADDARIAGDIPDYEIWEKSLESLQTFPMPQFSFVFDSKTITRDELPEDVRKILGAHWQEALKYFYTVRFNKPPDGQAYYKLTIAWLAYCSKTDRGLRDSLIEAPNGPRKISETEARTVWGFLNRAALDVMDKAGAL